MEGTFTSSNFKFLITPFMIIVVVLLSTAYIIWHKKDKIDRILSLSLITFLVLYFPLIDYYTFWNISVFWPDDFYHQSDQIIPSSGDTPYGHYPTVKMIFNILSIVSSFIFLFSSILFIKTINLKQNNNLRFLNWFPLINSFTLGHQIKKTLNKKWYNILLLKIWVIFTFLLIYYKFFAGWLYFYLGFDSISFIGDILYPNTPEFENSEYYDVGYTFIADLLSIIIPPLLYVSGILTFLIVKQIKKQRNYEFDAEISKIGES